MARPVTDRPASHVKKVHFTSGKTILIQTAMRPAELRSRMPDILRAYHELRKKQGREDASRVIAMNLLETITHGAPDDRPNMQIISLDGKDWIAFSKAGWIASIDGTTVFRRAESNKKTKKKGRTTL